MLSWVVLSIILKIVSVFRLDEHFYNWGKLFGGTVLPNNTLFGGTVPPNNTLFGGTPHSKKLYLIQWKVLEFMNHAILAHLKENLHM